MANKYQKKSNGAKKKKRSLPVSLTDGERNALLKMPNARYPTGFRNYVMIRLMLDAGLRCAEVLALKLVDVELQAGKLTVRDGKGGKDRTLWLNEEMLDSLRRWRAGRPVESELYFTTLKGTEIDGRYVREMVKRYGKKAGIKKDVHPHILRHTFACDLYRESKDLEKVRKALGHADISTTGIYLHVVDDELEASMKNFRQKSKTTAMSS